MLDTVLKIGNIYRNSEEGLKHHRYIKSVNAEINNINNNKDKNDKKIETVVFELPIIENENEYFFDFENIKEIYDKDKINSLYFLNFKTTDADSTKKYLFGDIVYAGYENNKGKFNEDGNYRMKSAIRKKSSFDSCEEVASNFKNTIIEKFRESFKQNQENIENFLCGRNSTVLHFKFPENRNWYNLEDALNIINKELVKIFVKEEKAKKVFFLDSFLFKTLTSGTNTPDFRYKNSFKVKSFTNTDEIIDLMYAVDVSERALITVKGIGIIVLPQGKNLTYENIKDFLEKTKLHEIQEAESLLNSQNQNTSNSFDNLFAPILVNNFDDKVKFDIIFSKPKAATSPSVDMLEISSIEKSLLKEIHEKIIEVKNEIKSLTKTEFPKADFNFQIESSFRSILGGNTKDDKKYSFHLLKVLPQIYSGTYYQDPILLPAFIEKVEYNIRNREGEKDNKHPTFNLLKYNFYLLMKIQKNNNLMEIQNAKSYQLGKQMGIIARPFASWRDDCPISSFEAAYVGNLTRKIATEKEVEEFAVFMLEKLTIHKISYKEQTEAFSNFMEVLKSFNNEQYDKNKCALGFFESFYAKSKSEQSLKNQI
jgi:hypothetical protein